MTEQLADVEPQDIITKDNLNARVDLQVYFKVKNRDDEIKKSYYQVDDYKYQIIALAQTTARNVIGDMKFIDVNNQRNELNTKLADVMRKEIENWGVEVVRVELKEITPPKEVQETMNRVIQAQNQKDAAIDFATAEAIAYCPVLQGTNTKNAYTAIDREADKISDQDYKYLEKLIESLKYPWEESFSGKNIFASSFDEIDKYNIIHSFADNLLKELHDIDPSFADIINEDFWDLV